MTQNVTLRARRAGGSLCCQLLLMLAGSAGAIEHDRCCQTSQPFGWARSNFAQRLKLV